MLKLPKSLADPTQLAALTAYFTRRERPLLAGSEAKASELSYDGRLENALKTVLGTGHLVQGLEQIEALLDREQKGLVAVRERTGQPTPQRLSRLMFISNDGSERFLRNTASIQARHADRLMVCLIDAPSTTLGALSAKGQPAKAFLIDDKKALALFLSRLVAN